MVVSVERTHIVVLLHVGILRFKDGDRDVGAVGGDALEIVQRVIENEARFQRALSCLRRG